MTSAERRVTISGTIWQKVAQLAERDQVAAADVVNAILLQTLQPYGGGSVEPTSASPATTPDTPDPYQAAVPTAW